MMFTHNRYFHNEYLNLVEKDLTYHGHWWIPTMPENRLAGVLYLKKNGGIKLSLMGMFEADLRKDWQFVFSDHQIILGEIVPGGAPITLWDCKEIERKSPYVETTAKGTSQKFMMAAALFGFHLRTANDFKFKYFEFSTTYLTDWTGYRKFDIAFEKERSIITELEDQKIKFQFNNNAITFTTWGRVSFGKDHNTIQRTSVEVEYLQSATINEFKDEYLVPIVDLVQFGTSHLNSVIYLNATPIGQSKAEKLIITNHFDTINYSHESFQQNGLFRLSEFSDIQEQLITGWLSLHEEIPHVFKLYFDSIHIGFQFQATKFLNLIQAVESYHAVRENNDNKMTLRERVSALLQETGNLFSGTIEDLNKFVDDIMDTRNYYTHFSKSKKTKAAVDLKLDALIHMARLILSYHFLIRCSIPGSNAKDILTRGSYWGGLKQLIHENGFWKR